MAVSPLPNGGFMATFGSGDNRRRKRCKTREAGEAWEAEQEAQEQAKKALPEASAAPAKPVYTLKQAFKAVEVRWAGKANEGNNTRNAAQALVFFGDDCPLSEITPDRIAEWVSELREDYTGATCNRKLATLCVALRRAFMAGNLDRPPMIERLEESEGRIRWYSEEEEAKMLGLCKHLGMGDLHDFIVIGIDTGYRRTELLGLHMADYVNGALILHKTKNGKPHSVPCTARIREILKARQEAGEKMVFRTMTYATLRLQWALLRKHMDRQDDPYFIVHVLRHTCATRLVSKGVRLQVVQKWMNHLTITTTQRYAHLMPTALVEAMGALEAAA